LGVDEKVTITTRIEKRNREDKLPDARRPGKPPAKGSCEEKSGPHLKDGKSSPEKK